MIGNISIIGFIVAVTVSVGCMITGLSACTNPCTKFLNRFAQRWVIAFVCTEINCNIHIRMLLSFIALLAFLYLSQSEIQ